VAGGESFVAREATGQLLKTISDLHNDSLNGLCQLASALGGSVRCPHPSKKLNVLLLGGSKASGKLTEHFCGTKTKTAERSDCFALVRGGASKRVGTGEDALSALCECLGREGAEALRAFKGADRAVVHEEVEADKNDFVLVNLVRAPDLVGLKSKNLDWRGSIMKEVAETLKGRQDAAKRLFDKYDSNKDKMLSQEDLKGVLGEVDIGISNDKVEALCRALDFGDKGSVHWEEFLAAFKDEKDPCSLEQVEEAILSVAGSCDLVLVLMDPIKARVSVRDVDLAEQVMTKFKSKAHVCCFLDESRQQIKGMAQLIRDCGAALSKRCKDESLKALSACFPHRTPALTFEGVTANHVDELCSFIGRSCDKILAPYLDTVESNIINVYRLAQAPNAKPELRQQFIQLMSAYARRTAGARDFVSKQVNGYCIQAGGHQEADPLGGAGESAVVRVDLSSESAKQAKAEVSAGQTDKWQTSTHIALWLESLGLHQYITSFQQSKIDTIAMLVKLTNDDLLDLRVESRHRELILGQVELLKKKGDVRESEKFRQPLFELLEARLITPQELQMMYGVLQKSIVIPQHKLTALESALKYYSEARINAKTVSEVCKDVRRQAARMLGLLEDDTTKSGDKVDTRKVEEEVKKCLKGKYDDAYDVFAYVDKKSEGKLATDDFVSALVDLLPPNIERKKIRKLARAVAKDGSVDYHDFLDKYTTVGRGQTRGHSHRRSESRDKGRDGGHGGRGGRRGDLSSSEDDRKTRGRRRGESGGGRYSSSSGDEDYVPTRKSRVHSRSTSNARPTTTAKGKGGCKQRAWK